jgi:acetyl esterase/lipase
MLMISPERGNKFLPRMNAKLKFEGGVKRERTVIGGVGCDVFTAIGSPDKKTLLYIHGGGFVYGQTPMHLNYCAMLSERLKMRVIAIDYSLKPYPAGLNDCFSVYRHVLNKGAKPKDIAVAGDSAGGCYTLTLLLKLKEQKLPLPAAAVCISPCVSGEDSGFDRTITDPMLPHRACLMFSARYRGGADPKNPLISPIYGDFAGMPPILIYSGERETLLTSVKAFAERAKREGWNIAHKVVPHMFHIFPIYTDIREGKQATDEIIGFLNERLDEI